MNRASGDLNLAKKIKALATELAENVSSLQETLQSINSELGIRKVNHVLSADFTIYPTDGMFSAALRGQDLVGTDGLVAKCEYIGEVYEQDDPDYEGDTPWRKDYRYRFGSDGMGNYIFACTFEAATEEDANNGNFVVAEWFDMA